MHRREMPGRAGSSLYGERRAQGFPHLSGWGRLVGQGEGTEMTGLWHVEDITPLEALDAELLMMGESATLRGAKRCKISLRFV